MWEWDVHNEMVRTEFMCGNFVAYRLNLNTLQFRGHQETENTKQLVGYDKVMR